MCRRQRRPPRTAAARAESRPRGHSPASLTGTPAPRLRGMCVACASRGAAYHAFDTVLDASIALQLFIYGLTNGAVVALNAIGFSLAYSVARPINLAHGNVFALSTVVVASAASWFGVAADAPIPQRL